MGVVVATVVGLALRLSYVLGPARERPLGGDDAYYHGLAGVLADGHGFIEPLTFVVTGERVESATHPPLFPLLLAVPTWFGVDTPLGHRVITVLIGCSVVPLVALVALRLGGPRAAVWAAGFAAVNPALWMNDVNVLSEALLAPLVAAVVLAWLVARERCDWQSAAVLGALIGLATLTRAETLLFLPLLVAPILWRRPRELACATAAALVVLAPWVGYNVARFDEPVLLSNNFGGTLASASCDAVWYGDRIGWWQFGCHDVDHSGDESVRDQRFRRVALDYISDHPERAPLVMAARVGRIWNVYRPLQTVRLDSAEGRGHWPPRAGLALYVVIAGFGIAGAVVLRERGRPLAWLVAPLVLVTLVAALFYGSARFRVPADVVLTIAAGIGASVVVRRDTTTALRTRLRARRSGGTGARTGATRR